MNSKRGDLQIKMIVQNGSIEISNKIKDQESHRRGGLMEHKLMKYAQVTLKMLVLCMCLYFFIISLNLMSTSFPLLGGKNQSHSLSLI